MIDPHGTTLTELRALDGRIDDIVAQFHSGITAALRIKDEIAELIAREQKGQAGCRRTTPNVTS